MSSKSAPGQGRTFSMRTHSMIEMSGTRPSASLLTTNRKILASRYIFIDQSKFTIDNPPKDEIKYDLRNSDFNADRTVISIADAIEK